MHHYELSRGVKGMGSEVQVLIGRGCRCMQVDWGGVLRGVDGYDRCRDEEVPQISEERRLDSRQYEYEVVFGGADGAFSKIRAMISRWLELCFYCYGV